MPATCRCWTGFAPCMESRTDFSPPQNNTQQANDHLTLRLFREATWSNGTLQLLLHLCHLHHAEEAQAKGLEPLPREAFVSRPEAEEVCRIDGNMGGKRRLTCCEARRCLFLPSLPFACVNLSSRILQIQVYEAREEHFLRKFLRQALKEGLFRTSTHTHTHAAEGSLEEEGVVAIDDWAKRVRRSFAPTNNPR